MSTCLRNLIFCVVVMFLAAMVLSSPTAEAQSSPQFRTYTLPQIKAIEDKKATRTPAQAKISSALLDSLAQAQTGHAVAGAPQLAAPTLPSTNDGVLVDIKGHVTPDLINNIDALWG
jgi:hypothetical protein